MHVCVYLFVYDSQCIICLVECLYVVQVAYREDLPFNSLWTWRWKCEVVCHQPLDLEPTRVISTVCTLQLAGCGVRRPCAAGCMVTDPLVRIASVCWRVLRSLFVSFTFYCGGLLALNFECVVWTNITYAMILQSNGQLMCVSGLRGRNTCVAAVAGLEFGLLGLRSGIGFVVLEGSVCCSPTFWRDSCGTEGYGQSSWEPWAGWC